MNAAEAKSIILNNIYPLNTFNNDERKQIGMKERPTDFMIGKAQGYLECLGQVGPVIDKARYALTISRAANNKTELWEAWADNLEQEMKNTLAQWDDTQENK